MPFAMLISGTIHWFGTHVQGFGLRHIVVFSIFVAGCKHRRTNCDQKKHTKKSFVHDK
jgi:organic radical activating enzyme